MPMPCATRTPSGPVRGGDPVIVAIGMDPGPTPGLVKLTYSDGLLLDVAVVQCTANCALDVLAMWLNNLPVAGALETYVQVERFVVGKGSYRTGSPGARTRDMVGSAVTLAEAHNAVVAVRTASEAKAWASNGRLLAAGIEGDVRGMTHARDGARHALYTAVKDGRIPDPFSKRARRTSGE